MGCGVLERHLEMAQTTTKNVNVPSCSQIFLVILRLNEQGVVEVVEERDVIGRGRWHGFN